MISTTDRVYIHGIKWKSSIDHVYSLVRLPNLSGCPNRAFRCRLRYPLRVCSAHIHSLLQLEPKRGSGNIRWVAFEESTYGKTDVTWLGGSDSMLLASRLLSALEVTALMPPPLAKQTEAFVNIDKTALPRMAAFIRDLSNCGSSLFHAMPSIEPDEEGGGPVRTIVDVTLASTNKITGIAPSRYPQINLRLYFVDDVRRPEYRGKMELKAVGGYGVWYNQEELFAINCYLAEMLLILRNAVNLPALNLVGSQIGEPLTHDRVQRGPGFHTNLDEALDVAKSLAVLHGRPDGHLSRSKDLSPVVQLMAGRRLSPPNLSRTLRGCANIRAIKPRADDWEIVIDNKDV